MPGEVTSSVGIIETEAEKMLAEARAKASEILLKAREESNQILSSDLPMDEVKTECEEIIHEAREEASRRAADSSERVSKIRVEANNKIEGIVERIVSIITTGADLK